MFGVGFMGAAPVGGVTIGGGESFVSDGSFEPFLARLTGKENLFTSGGTLEVWAWVEVNYAAGGTFETLEGGRSGGGDTAGGNPAFEVGGGDTSQAGEYVWLRPGYFSEEYGQEWLFKFSCTQPESSDSSSSDDTDDPDVTCGVCEERETMPSSLTVTLSSLTGDLVGTAPTTFTITNNGGGIGGCAWLYEADTSNGEENTLVLFWDADDPAGVENMRILLISNSGGVCEYRFRWGDDDEGEFVSGFCDPFELVADLESTTGGCSGGCTCTITE